MQIEIPVNKFDEIIPKKYCDQLENLAIERYKKANIFYLNHLPLSLETIKSKLIVQQQELKKIIRLLKRISLKKFDDDKNYILQDDVKLLFNLFLNLPLRVNFQQFLTETVEKENFFASELFYHLKKFHHLHPLSMTKEEFNNLLSEISKKSKIYFIEGGSKRNNQLENMIAEKIKRTGFDFKSEFYDFSEKEIVSKQIFKKILEKNFVKHKYIIFIVYLKYF